MSYDAEYYFKIKKMVNSMQVGSEFSIVDNVHPDRRDLFIQIIKDIMYNRGELNDIHLSENVIIKIK